RNHRDSFVRAHNSFVVLERKPRVSFSRTSSNRWLRNASDRRQYPSRTGGSSTGQLGPYLSREYTWCLLRPAAQFSSDILLIASSGKSDHKTHPGSAQTCSCGFTPSVTSSVS